MVAFGDRLRQSPRRGEFLDTVMNLARAADAARREL
jgi:hypothetical protein